MFEIARIAKRGKTLADILAVTDRALKRIKIDFLVRLGEPQFPAANVTYA